jgi:hypothetical protein
MPYLGSISISHMHHSIIEENSVSVFTGSGAGGRRLKRYDFSPKPINISIQRIGRLVHKL